MSGVSRRILKGEIKQGIVRADHCRFQSELDEIRRLEGYYDSVGLCTQPVDVTYSNRKPGALWATFHS